MSAAEIINELPKLTEADRRAVREALLEIANQHPDVALCNETAIEAAVMLDGIEITPSLLAKTFRGELAPQDQTTNPPKNC